MLSIPDYLIQLSSWEGSVQATCPDPRFVLEVSHPWHRDIAPPRAHHYGIDNFFRYGPRGVFAQIITKYARWRRQESIDDPLFLELDTLRDMYGYSVILGVVADTNPDKLNWSGVWLDLTTPDTLFARMEDAIWWDKEPDREPNQNVRMALTMTFAAWKISYGRSTHGE